MKAGDRMIIGTGNISQIVTVKRINKNKTVRVSFYGRGQFEDVVFSCTVKANQLKSLSK